MKPVALSPTFAPNTDGFAPARAARTKTDNAALSPESLKAARDFEAIFLRTLLAPLEKTTQLGSKPSIAAGQSTFGGMVVSAMADSLTNAGGIGLADVVARALSARGASAAR